MARMMQRSIMLVLSALLQFSIVSSHTGSPDRSCNATREEVFSENSDLMMLQFRSMEKRANASRDEHGHSSHVTKVSPWDCINFGTPIQLLGNGPTKFTFKQLDVKTGKYVAVYDVPKSRTKPPYADLNSCGINPIDNIAYCILKQGENYIVRIDRNSIEFVAKVPGYGNYNTGSFSPDGTFFGADKKARFIVATDLDKKPGFKTKKDTGLLDLSKIPLVKPSKFHSAADVVVVNANLEKQGDKQYLIIVNKGALQVARFDKGKFGKTWMIPYFMRKENGQGRKGKWGDVWGAGWSFQGKVFFASNKGEGVYLVNLTRLDLTKPISVLKGKKGFDLNRMGSSQPSGMNDGANCMNSPDPWETCGTYTCNGTKKSGVDDLRFPNETRCCKPTCGTYTCKKTGWVKKAGVDSKMLAPNDAKCCEATCEGFQCPAKEGFVKKSGVDDQRQPSKAKCCKATCGAYTCKTKGWVKKTSGGGGLSGANEGSCCEATCAAYTCTTKGAVKKSSTASERLPSEDKCCEATCATYTCTGTGWVKKSGVAKTINPTEATCCEATCSSYTCKTKGWVSKKSAAKQTSPTEATCCEGTCGSYNCTTSGWVKKAGLKTALNPSEGKCCEATCAAFTCKTKGWTKKQNVGTTTSPDETKCCEATCASFKCTSAGYVKKANVEKLTAPTEAKCCQATCAGYSCKTSGWVKKKGIGKAPNPSEEICCEATCSSHKCSTKGWVKKGGVDKVTSPSEATCCEGTCRAYECKTPGFVKKAGVDAATKPSEDKCCTATCTAYTCKTAGWVKQINVSTALDPSEAKCCEATCASYTCTSRGFVKKAGIDSTLNPSEDICCQATCASYKCKTSGWVKKLGAEAAIGPNETTCCEATCASYTCDTAGWVKKSNVSSLRAPAEASCCEPTCAAHACATAGWVKKAGVESLKPPAEATCCEATCATFTCPLAGWVKKPTAENFTSPSQDQCCQATCAAINCTNTYGWVTRPGVAAELVPSQDKCCIQITRIPPFDCAAHPQPLQILWNRTYGYSVDKLAMLTGDYANVFTLPFTATTPPYKYLNAVGINPVDGITYGCLMFDEYPADFFVVRFGKDQVEFIAKIVGSHDPIAGTFSSTGEFFFMSKPPVLYSMKAVNAMVGYLDPNATSLPVLTNYSGLTISGYTQIADIVPFTYDLLGTGTATEFILGINRDEQVALIDWQGENGAQSKVWRFLTNDVLSAQDATENFGAAWNFNNRVFFASNDGVGVFEPVKFDLATKKVNLTMVGKSKSIYNNDGFNCWGIKSPFPTAQ